MTRKGDFKLNSVKDELIQFYVEGNSLAECGRQFRVAPQSVKTFIIAQGIESRSLKEAMNLVQEPLELDPRRDEIIAAYHEGATAKEVAAQYGLERWKVDAFLIRIGARRTHKEWGRIKKERNVQAKAAAPQTAPDPGPYRICEERNRPLPTQASFDFLSTEPMRHCPRCDKDVPRSGWSRWSRRTHKHRDTYCRRCCAEYLRERRKIRPLSEETKAREAEGKKAYREKIKQGVFAAYGNACACCGESTPEFLVIDHALGGGNKHRVYLKSIGVHTVHNLYFWLRKNGYPPEFRILCSNCNSAHAWYGYCPHQEPRDFLDVASESKLRLRKLRLRLISGYGGRCECCGETRPEFLSLEHKHGGGGKHYRALEAIGKCSHVLYKELVDSGFPPGYGIICHCCNHAYGHYECCPHKTISTT